MVRHKDDRSEKDGGKAEDAAVRAPSRRRLSAARRRDLVVDAATTAFAEHGYEGASVRDIAEQAGVVASVVYDHFGSKRDLYLELLTRHGRSLIDETMALPEVSSVGELFEVGQDAFYRFVEHHPFVWRMIFRDPPADAEAAAVHDAIQRAASEAIASLIASIRPGEDLVHGIDRGLADQVLAEGIKSVNTGLAGWWYEHRDIPREQVVAASRALLWTGLGTLASPPGPSGR